MIGFSIKKTFFDIWDNLLMLVLMSVGYIVPLSMFLLAGYLIEAGTIFTILGCIIGVLLFSMYSLMVSAITFGYSRNHKGGFKAVKDAFRFHIGHAFLHAGILIALFFIFFSIIPFYFNFGNMLGLMMGMILFWICVGILLALQYFFPLCFHMEGDGAFKTFKKCFIIVADNFWVSLFLAIRNIIGLIFTILTALMIPGFAGISLSRMNTIKLLMHKYDFLEANPNCTKKDINWEDLLYEEKQLVGPRSFKGMIFPWKD